MADDQGDWVVRTPLTLRIKRVCTGCEASFMVWNWREFAETRFCSENCEQSFRHGYEIGLEAQREIRVRKNIGRIKRDR